MTEPISTGEMAANLLARLAVTEARAERAEAEAAMLRKALEKVEYLESEEQDADTLYCPWCLVFKRQGGHASNCSRQLALAASPVAETTEAEAAVLREALENIRLHAYSLDNAASMAWDAVRASPLAEAASAVLEAAELWCDGNWGGNDPIDQALTEQLRSAAYNMRLAREIKKSS